MPTTEREADEAARTGYAVEYWSGRRELRGEGTPSFVLSVTDESQLHRILEADTYSTAMAFIRGRFEVRRHHCCIAPEREILALRVC